jgi:hypothetical protein
MRRTGEPDAFVTAAKELGASIKETAKRNYLDAVRNGERPRNWRRSVHVSRSFHFRLEARSREAFPLCKRRLEKQAPTKGLLLLYGSSVVVAASVAITTAVPTATVISTTIAAIVSTTIAAAVVSGTIATAVIPSAVAAVIPTAVAAVIPTAVAAVIPATIAAIAIAHWQDWRTDLIRSEPGHRFGLSETGKQTDGNSSKSRFNQEVRHFALLNAETSPGTMTLSAPQRNAHHN